MKASVRFEHQLLAVEAEHRVHAMLEIESPMAPDQAKRPPLRLALVLDRSGSMAGRKLEVTKECATFLVRRLAPTDEVALVAYDDHVNLVAPLAPVNQEALMHVIGSIHSGGSTNLSGGWLKGMEEVKRGSGEGVRKVLLLTDGLANVGITDPPRLVGMTTNARGAGVGTTTVGFGDGFNEQLLTSMADAGGGKSYYAADPEQAPGIFAEEFEGLMSLVAQNVSVEIRPSSDVQVLGVLNEYPIVDVPGGLQVDLGDAYGEERRRVVFQLLIPELTRLGVAKVADVVLRYVSVGEETAHHEVTIPLNVNLVSADEAAASETDAQVREEVTILGSAKAQKEARDRADRGDFDSAKRLMASSIEQLEQWLPHSDRQEELRSELEQLKANEAMMDQASWSPAASKSSHFQSHRMQRSRPPTKRGEGESPTNEVR
jgi:Ca-activated chloride channel homolog